MRGEAAPYAQKSKRGVPGFRHTLFIMSMLSVQTAFKQQGFLNTNILLTLCATRRAQKTEGLPVWAIPLRLNLSKLVLLLA